MVSFHYNMFIKNKINKFIILFLFFFFSRNIFAESQLPFESALQKLSTAIQGPFLLSSSIIMVIVTCLMLAFGEWDDGFKKIITIVLWLSIAFGVTSFIGFIKQ